MHRWLLGLAAAAALAACSAARVHLEHPTKAYGSPEYEDDVAACRIYANSAAPMVVTSGHGPQRNIDTWTRHYHGCMRDKGWEPVDEAGQPVDAFPRVPRGAVDSRDADLR